MRCPKCGYTSFDDLERCKKCKKPMPPASATLTGTVLEAVAPAYLLWGAAAMTGQLGAGAKGGSPLFAASDGPRAEMQIPVDEETALESAPEPATPEVDAATSPAVAAQEPAEEMKLELGKVDISDLTAPDEVPTPAEDEDDFTLENLQMDDLGLEAPSPTASAPESGQYQPASKTGTALDNFDIELDELLDEESEKA